MKLKNVKAITYIGIVSICVLLFALLITKNAVFGFITIAGIIIVAAFEWKFWRCPYCNKGLGRLDDKGKYCQNCGKEIEK